MQMQLYEGRPQDMQDRLPKEIAVYDLLDKLGISYQRVDHEAAFTMAACQEIDRLLVPAVICKNLLLCNAQKTSFYLLMLCDGKKFRTGAISRQIGSSRLSFAPPEEMESSLDITPGSLSVLGLMNDHAGKVQLLIDKDILAADAFGCHPCVNTSSLRIRVCDLLDRFLPAVHHGYQSVHAE